MRRQVDHDEVNVDIFNDDALDEELATRADEVVAATAMRSNASSDVGSSVAVGESSDGTRRARTCSYTKYKKVERSLCVYIRGSETVLGAGLRQQDVVEWYLNQQEDIADLDELGAERRLVRQIIQRLLSADKILVEVAPPEDAALASKVLGPHDNRYITVRPHVEL
jgi:hypothetical protein